MEALKLIADYLEINNGGHYFIGECGSDYDDIECRDNQGDMCGPCNLLRLKWKDNAGRIARIRSAIERL